MVWVPHEVAAPAARRYPAGRYGCVPSPVARAALGRGGLAGSDTGATVSAGSGPGQRAGGDAPSSVPRRPPVE